MGKRRWYIIRCHLAPNGASTIDSVVTAMKEHTRGAKLLVAGDFYTDLA